MVVNQLSECLLSGFANDGDSIEFDFDESTDEIVAINKNKKKAFPLEQFGGIEGGCGLTKTATKTKSKRSEASEWKQRRILRRVSYPAFP